MELGKINRLAVMIFVVTGTLVFVYAAKTKTDISLKRYYQPGATYHHRSSTDFIFIEAIASRLLTSARK
ncbi:hypothetical protein EXU57_12150 [Segetibacter sp. 3557_3]|uniref:hypothetical protein n=1 Tax=Segetibacter sp. 3557_3 TaxID=2547429 RepID=UPI001058ABE1|nr:hypothetical protein [Segetibacter sp. 3557_3]TDH26233.1 hypothetical protein EXU57_12150 [Segetibacter sp. 3557_3]